MEDIMYDQIASLIIAYSSSNNEFIYDILIGEYDDNPLARIIIGCLDSKLTSDEKIYDIMDTVFEIDPTLPVEEFTDTVQDMLNTIKRISEDH